MAFSRENGFAPFEVNDCRSDRVSAEHCRSVDAGLRAAVCGFRYGGGTVLPEIPSAPRLAQHQYAVSGGREGSENGERCSSFLCPFHGVQSRTEDSEVVATVPPRDLRALRVAESSTCKNEMQAPWLVVGSICTPRGKIVVWGTTQKWLGTGCWEEWGRRAVTMFQWVWDTIVEDTRCLPWREKRKDTGWLINTSPHILQETTTLSEKMQEQQYTVKGGVVKSPTKGISGATSAKDGNVAANTSAKDGNVAANTIK